LNRLFTSNEERLNPGHKFASDSDAEKAAYKIYTPKQK
jgi:hypothetical protein